MTHIRLYLAVHFTSPRYVVYNGTYKCYVVHNTLRRVLHPRILSPLEERQIKAFIKQDGEKNVNMRVLTFLARKNLPQIRRDLEILEKLLAKYHAEGDREHSRR